RDVGVLVLLLDGLGRGGEVVPGLGRLDAPLVEQVLAVVEAHRPAGLRDRVDLAGEDAGLPLPVDELARVALGVLGDVLERAVDEEGGQRVVADLGHVGGVAGLHGREHLGVAAVGAGGDGLQVDLDVRGAALDASTAVWMSGPQDQNVSSTGWAGSPPPSAAGSPAPQAAARVTAARAAAARASFERMLTPSTDRLSWGFRLDGDSIRILLINQDPWVRGWTSRRRERRVWGGRST